MENKRVLISGAAGSIGSELVRQLAAKNKVFGLDINETDLFDLYEELRPTTPIKTRVGDIRDPGTLGDVFDGWSPDVVLHAAAYKHVSPMELDPIEAVRTNIIGTSNLVRQSKKSHVEKFINISTDKVVNAESVMGLTKKITERIVRNAGYVSVRFGNVLGSRGSVIPIWQKQLAMNVPLTVTDERMMRYFMTIEEACQLVIEAVYVGEPGEIVVLDMGAPKSILELAKEILGKLGRPDYPVEIVGPRPGEQFREEVMTESEKGRAVKRDKFWVIP